MKSIDMGMVRKNIACLDVGNLFTRGTMKMSKGQRLAHLYFSWGDISLEIRH